MNSSRDTVLSWNQPVAEFAEGMPIGNGRLGAMVRPQADGTDRIDLNEESCWSGGAWSTAGTPVDPRPADAWRQTRELLLAGDVAAAEQVVRRVQFGHSQAYQPVGSLNIGWAGAEGSLRRELETVVGMARWSREGETWEGTAEAFASHPDQVVVIDYQARKPGDGTVQLELPHSRFGATTVEMEDTGGTAVIRLPSDVFPPHDLAEPPVVYDDRPAVTAHLGLRLLSDGEIATSDEGRWRVRQATWLRALVAIETDYRGPARAARWPDPRRGLARQLDAAQYRPLGQLRRDHAVDRTRVTGPLTLRLGAGSIADTDDLLAQSSHTSTSPALAARAVHLARHLLVSGSRAGTTATPLQGLWNQDVRPAWSANYTVNINTEMNYWPVGPFGLWDCVEPLEQLVRTLSETGTETARDVLGSDGWVAFHNADLWGFSRPVGTGTSDPCWAAWPMAGPWLLRTLWERFEYTLDEEWLRDVWLPLADGAVAAGLAQLVDGPGSTLVTAPATSPENHYLLADGSPVALSLASTMDDALLRDLFTSWLNAGDLLERPHELRERVAAALPRIPWPEVTPDQAYPEWRVAFEEAEPTHRHVSHLFDFHPGDAALRRPDARARVAAARQSLLDRGLESTGWALAWRVALAARLRDRDLAEAYLHRYFTLSADTGPEDGYRFNGGVYSSLLCAHPPFQIDGNFGVAAGVFELLAQSRLEHGDGWPRTVTVDLLPCLPSNWPEGEVRALHLRGGLSLDLAWRAGAVVSAKLHATRDVTVTVQTPGDPPRTVELAAGTSSSV